jgi:hypothetical protein
MKAVFNTKIILSVLLIISISLFKCSENELIKPDQSKTNSRGVSPSSCSSCTFVVPETAGVFDGAALGVKPGDVICLDAALKYTKSINFRNLNGTATHPIIITQCGNGVVNLTVHERPYNVKFSYSKYFHFSGGKTSKQYGITISGSTACGLVLGEITSDFEVDHIEVFNVDFAGIMAKTDPTCDVATNRDHYVMRNVSIHDNYVHDTGGEGFYIGHSSYGGYKTDSCGIRYPHLIENIKVYKNLVKNSGWDGIQLSCAHKGAQLFDNIVMNYATKQKPDQNCGIVIGAGTGGSCYGNYIKGGSGPGITVFGLADNLIHNNIIVDAGKMGIFCDERTSPGTGYKIINNTIINPKTEGMRIYAQTVPSNLVMNNIIVNPGSYLHFLKDAYIMKLKSVPLIASNNYTTRNIKALKFENAALNNYRLTSTSPVIDKGKDISSYHIKMDFYNTARLKGAAYNIGASENY